MKFKLNCSPHLRMEEITKKLFNLNFLSDIQFLVGDKIIYAHSLELMKRSAVFENDLEDTFGKKKIIPITECKYEVFLEFVRFIYTDDCKIDDNNRFELLKLAIKYKIIMLENRVINSVKSAKFCLQLFNHCIINKYNIARHRSIEVFQLNCEVFLKDPQFLSLHSDSINVAVQLDKIKNGVSEFQIFDAMGKWITNYGKANQMSLKKLRGRFDELIKSIRFPLMSQDEIRECVKLYPGLLTDSDCMTISRQVLFGNDEVNDIWSSKQREGFVYPFESRTFDRGTTFKTKFTVAQDMILHGLRIGIELKNNKIELEIAEKGDKTNNSDLVILSPPKFWPYMLISLGDSIHLRPRFEYTITTKFLDITDSRLEVVCRNENVDLICDEPKTCVKILEAGESMFELLFK